MEALAKITPATTPAEQMVAAKTDGRRYARPGFTALLVALGLLFAWAAVAPLRGVVVADGRFVVAAQKTAVQHRDGGRIERVLVADGDRVAAGQPLLRLDTTALADQLEDIRRERFALQANVERLTAERDKLGSLAFSQGLLGDIRGEADRDILDLQLAVFERRRLAVASEKAVQEQRSRQATTQIVGLNRAIGSLRERARLLDKDFAGLQDPGADRRVADTEVRELWRRQTALIDEIAASEAEIARLRESIARNSQQALLRQREYRRELATTLRDLQTGLIALEARQAAVAEKLARVEITAPAAGRVKGLGTVTTGAVIPAGTAIMEIVPTEPGYRVHAHVSPVDFDALRNGMRAEIRLATSDDSRDLPVVTAGLLDVSADVLAVEADSHTDYRATLAVDPAGLRVLADEGIELFAGMPVEVYIETGGRTLLDHLTRPMLELFARR